MGFTLKDGLIVNPQGHGLNFEGYEEDINLTKVTVSGAQGDGIRIIGKGGGARQPGPTTVAQLMDAIEAHVQEFPADRRDEVRALVAGIRTNPKDDAKTKRGLSVMWDILGHVSGSFVGAMLSKMLVE